MEKITLFHVENKLYSLDILCNSSKGKYIIYGGKLKGIGSEKAHDSPRDVCHRKNYYIPCMRKSEIWGEYKLCLPNIGLVNRAWKSVISSSLVCLHKQQPERAGQRHSSGLSAQHQGTEQHLFSIQHSTSQGTFCIPTATTARSSSCTTHSGSFLCILTCGQGPLLCMACTSPIFAINTLPSPHQVVKT